MVSGPRDDRRLQMNTTDNSTRTCLVLAASTFATVMSLASVWIVTAANYAPLVA